MFHTLVQIGVHYEGVFYEFVPWNGVVSWNISPWGYWYIAAENETHLVIVNLLSFSSLLCTSPEIVVASNLLRANEMPKSSIL